MSVWSTLYALTDDDGLESTGIRPVFDGMDDLSIGIFQPIVLVSPLGVVFVNADGKVLVRGTRVVTPLTPETSPVVEFATADGMFFATADGVIFSTGAPV